MTSDVSSVGRARDCSMSFASVGSIKLSWGRWFDSGTSDLLFLFCLFFLQLIILLFLWISDGH